MSTDRAALDRGDKAVLRLAAGLVLAVLLAYGLALPLPFAVCMITVLVLCKPGPAIPLLKGMLLAAVVAAVVAAGVLMVPLIEHYALAGIVLTGALLYAVFVSGGSGNPLATIVVLALTVIPVAAVAEQSLAPLLGGTLALGVAIGVLVSSASHAFFPDRPAPAAKAAAPAAAGRAAARWDALRATLVVMPVFVLALANPSAYLAAVMKSVALAQQAGATTAASAGRELVGSTLAGAWMGALAWFGLSLRPNLVMLALWSAAAALWAGARIFGVKPTSWPPSFWMNALVTMLILLGPAIEDSANGKDPLRASATRTALFVGVALYAWATVWGLERWRAARSDAAPLMRK